MSAQDKTEPVSYTHLDVYKRQALRDVPWWLKVPLVRNDDPLRSGNGSGPHREGVRHARASKPVRRERSAHDDEAGARAGLSLIHI